MLGSASHLKEFVPDDAALLDAFLAKFTVHATTAHVATEAAHFIGKLARTVPALRVQFVAAVRALNERSSPLRDVSSRDEFAWLDLADCGLLEVAGVNEVVLTTDAVLAHYRQGMRCAAVNFNHLREDVGLL